MELRDVPAPTLAHDDDVRLRIAAVGICGSDVHYYTTGRIGSQVVEYPFAVGHECSAVVDAVGPSVTRVEPGDRVAVEPAVACGTCDQCRVGRPHTCRHNRFLGCPGQAEGSLQEQIVMPERCCLPIRPSTSLEKATIVEPLSIGAYTVQLGGEIPAGADVAILGSGPIGLSTLLVLGAQRQQVHTYVTDKIDARLGVGSTLGATWTGNPDSGDVVADMLSEAPGGMDVVFECCGQQDALDQAVALLKPGGTLVLTGIPEVDRVSFVIDQMRRKEITLRNVRRQNGCVERALALVEDERVNIAPLITHHFSFDETQQAFDLVAAYADGVVKAVVTVDPNADR